MKPSLQMGLSHPAYAQGMPDVKSVLEHVWTLGPSMRLQHHTLQHLPGCARAWLVRRAAVQGMPMLLRAALLPMRAAAVAA